MHAPTLSLSAEFRRELSMSKSENRGRDKHMLSPDGDKKKKNSLFRRPSLSRKKTKEENSQRRAKSRDRIENQTEGLV